MREATLFVTQEIIGFIGLMNAVNNGPKERDPRRKPSPARIRMFFASKRKNGILTGGQIPCVQNSVCRCAFRLPRSGRKGTERRICGYSLKSQVER